jgi:glucan phosphorylase
MFALNVAKDVISWMLAATSPSVAARAMLIADCKKDIVYLKNCLPHSLLFYAGGLGLLAADHIKEGRIAVLGF